MGSSIAEDRSMNAASLGQASGYVLSGCAQPLLVQILRDAGLADARSQLYMFFYYLGPALVVLPMLFPSLGRRGGDPWPSSRGLVYKAVGISVFDTISASLNYAGASMAGPTVFAIVYSSVTIWTALFSRWLLDRSMNPRQWAGTCLVFCGLGITATDSVRLGDAVGQGCLLVLFGSAMHALTYVFCEAVMVVKPDQSVVMHMDDPSNGPTNDPEQNQNGLSFEPRLLQQQERLTVAQNCGIQATVACTLLAMWQLVYTLPHWKERVGDPVAEAGTTLVGCLSLLVLFAACNWVHTITFYETLVGFPGGATSAGVLKGLQAVLVFGLTHWAFCGHTGGEELCFTSAKFASLVTVVVGVALYGASTPQKRMMSPNRVGNRRIAGSYESIVSSEDIEFEQIHR